MVQNLCIKCKSIIEDLGFDSSTAIFYYAEKLQVPRFQVTSFVKADGSDIDGDYSHNVSTFLEWRLTTFFYNKRLNTLVVNQFEKSEESLIKHLEKASFSSALEGVSFSQLVDYFENSPYPNESFYSVLRGLKIHC